MIFRRGPVALFRALVVAVVGGAAVTVALAPAQAAAPPPIRSDVWMTIDHSVVTWGDLTFELTVRWGNKGLEDAANVSAWLGGGPTPSYDLVPGSAPAGWTTSTAGTSWTGNLVAGEVHEARIRVRRVPGAYPQTVEQFGGRIDGGAQRPEDSMDDRFAVDVHLCDLVSLYDFPASLRPACASHVVTYVPPPVQHNPPSEILHLPAAGQPIPPSTRPIPAPGAATGGAAAKKPSPKGTVAASSAKATPTSRTATSGASGASGAATGVATRSAATAAAGAGTTARGDADPTAAATPSPATGGTAPRALGPLAPVAAWTRGASWPAALLLAVVGLACGLLSFTTLRRRRR